MPSPASSRVLSRRYLLAAGVTFLGALAACTGASPTPAPKPPEASKPVAATGQASAPPSATDVAKSTPAAQVAAPTTVAPAKAGQPLLKVNILGRSGQNPVNYEGDVYKDVVKRFGIEFQYDAQLVGTAFDAKVNTLMAGGDPPHMMIIMNTTQLFQYASQGAFWEIEPFLKDKAALPAIGNYPTDVFDIVRLNGKLNSVPSARLSKPFNMHARMDWLDKFGMKMPGSADDIRAFAEAATRKDPDGNGQADTYGLIWAEGLIHQIDKLLPLVPYAFDIVTIWDEDKPGHIIPSYIQEKQKKYLAWQRDGVKDGIFDSDSVILKRADQEQRTAQGRHGVFYAAVGGVKQAAIRKNQSGAQLMPIPPLPTPSGKKRYTSGFIYAGNWTVTRTVKSDADVARLLKLLDWGCSQEGWDWTQFGPPANYVEKNGVKVLNDRGKKDGANSFWFTPPVDKYLYAKQEKEADAPELAAAQQKLVDEFDAIGELDPYLTTVPTATEIKIGAELERRRLEIEAQIISGKQPLDAWDKWVDEWRKAGGDQIIDERSKQYAVAPKKK